MSTVKTRFAPSPTGRMHVGNLRTALYAYLIAKHEGGDFILRIEDTDQERYVEGALDIIYHTLKETGLVHDEGPDLDGGVGPYVQSERQAQGIYLKYAKELVEKGEAYYCFCGKERLATLHAICLQISLQSLFRIFPHASCVHIFRDISGKYSKIHKGFSPFFPSSLKKSDDAICIRQIRNRLSYFTKMLVNTSSIHSAFCFI